MLKLLAILCIVVVSAGPAGAQLIRNGAGTLRIDFAELRTGGQLAGCELQFDQLVKDDTTTPPRPVWVEGVISWMAKPGTVTLLLKVETWDVTMVGGKVQKTPFDPAYAYATLAACRT